MGVCFLAVMLGSVVSDEPSEVVRSFLSQSRAARVEKIERVRKEIKHHQHWVNRYKRATIDPHGDAFRHIGDRTIVRSVKIKKERIALNEKLLREDEEVLRILLEGKTPYIPEIYPDELKTGQIGRMSFGFAFPNRGETARWKVIQVVNKTTLLLSFGKDWVWFENVSTDNLVDGKTVRYETPFLVKGTKSYRTVTGASKTVFVVEPFDMKPVLRVFEPSPLVVSKPKPKVKKPDDESRAASLLRLAKLFLKSKPDVAKQRLSEIVEKYPDTTAAKEAKTLLVELGTK